MEYGRLTLQSSRGMTVLLASSDPSASLRAQKTLGHLYDLARDPPQPEALEQSKMESPNADVVPSAVEPNAQPSTADLKDVAILLRYLAVADRKLSDQETECVSASLANFAARPDDVLAVMKDFKTIRSDERDASRALDALLTRSPEIPSRVLALGEALAAVDGRVTPKERERLEQIARWIAADVRNTA